MKIARILAGAASGVLMALVVVGCSKDADVNDYKQKTLEKNLGELQGVQGRYSGMLTSKSSNAPLGGLQFTLQASTQVVNSGDENRASATPILIANVQFGGPGSLNLAITAQNSFYDPSSGTFTADIPIQDGSSSTEAITVNGVIHGGVIDGELSALGYSDYGGSFHLILNGPAVNQLAEQGQPNTNLIFSQMNYQGTTTFQNGLTKPVHLVLTKPDASSAGDFLTMLSPVKPVYATFNYGNGAFVYYPNASWDQRTGRLSGGVATLANTQISLSLVCDTVGVGGLNCSQLSAGSSGVTATIHVDPAQGKLQEPPDSSANRDAITHIYNGEMQTGPAETLPVKFTVTYPARTRLQEIEDLYNPNSEKTLQVSYTVMPEMTVG